MGVKPQAPKGYKKCTIVTWETSGTEGQREGQHKSDERRGRNNKGPNPMLKRQDVSNSALPRKKSGSEYSRRRGGKPLALERQSYRGWGRHLKQDKPGREPFYMAGTLHNQRAGGGPKGKRQSPDVRKKNTLAGKGTNAENKNKGMTENTPSPGKKTEKAAR